MRRDLANDGVGGEDGAAVSDLLHGLEDGRGVGELGVAGREDGNDAFFIREAPRWNQSDGLVDGAQIAFRPTKGSVELKAEHEDRTVLSAAEGFGHLSLDGWRRNEQLHDTPSRRDRNERIQRQPDPMQAIHVFRAARKRWAKEAHCERIVTA